MRETERKRRSNKSKIEKFWPQRKAPSFEVLSSPSERFGPLTHTHTHTHTRTHTHTHTPSGELLSKDQKLCNSKRNVEAECKKKKKKKREERKKQGEKFKEIETVQIDIGDGLPQ